MTVQHLLQCIHPPVRFTHATINCLTNMPNIILAELVGWLADWSGYSNGPQCISKIPFLSHVHRCICNLQWINRQQQQQQLSASAIYATKLLHADICMQSVRVDARALYHEHPFSTGFSIRERYSSQTQTSHAFSSTFESTTVCTGSRWR